MGEDFSILVAPDHPTPIAIRTHVSDPVPYVIYRSWDEKDNVVKTYNEETAKASNIYFASGEELVKHFIKGN